jgi:hypothetical protein
MKIARIGTFVFSLLFVVFGGGFFVLMVYPDIGDWMSAQSWQPVNATLLSAELQSHPSSKSTTYEATATYRYRFNGRDYSSNRVALSKGADNIGSFQQSLGRKLERLYQAQQPVRAWVNPQNPGQALINRELRWGLLSLKMIFVLVFGGIGLAFMVASFKDKPAKVKVSPSLADDPNAKPWLNNKDWASPVIRSSAKKALWLMWGFALIWNAIMLPLASKIPGELQKGEWGILMVLVFNVVGLVVVIMAIRKTLEWKRFGATLLTMDPHPGAIGGQVGGYIDVKLPYRPGRKFRVVLSNIYSYVSGTGKNRSRHEKVVWQDIADVEATHAVQGSRVAFCFDVPDNLNDSEEFASKYYKWTVSVSADLPGVDLDRSFEIPVFATGQRSSRSVQQNKVHHTTTDEPAPSADSPVQIHRDPTSGTLGLYYPPGRSKSMAMVLALTGSIFFAVGIFLGFQYWSGRESSFMLVVMGGLFFIAGLLMDYGAFYTLTNALLVRVDSNGIKTLRKIAGVSLFQRHVDRADIRGIRIDRGAQSNNTVYYRIFVDTRQGRRVKIGESFVGESSAKRILALVKKDLQL